MDKQYRKPHPDAIATKYGWALPKTGEVLVCRRDLPNPVEGFKPNRPFIVKESKPEVKPAKPAKVEPVVEEVKEEKKPEKKPAASTRKKVNAKSAE